MKNLRQLLWLYLVLLIFEGSLRKWLIPALDVPLLLVRDPVVILIYIVAWRHRFSFESAFLLPTLALAAATAFFSTLFGWGNALVTIFGLRTDFLQIPLIFLMPQVLNRDDILKMGRFILYISIPMALLVILQFLAPPDGLLNKGAMTNAYGTVRPSGSFSFVTGVGSFNCLAAAFLLFGYIQHRTYKVWLLVAVTIALLLAAACSGSRGGVVSLGIVVVVAVLSVIMRGKGGLGIIGAAIGILLAVSLLSGTELFKEGTEQLTDRFSDASDTEGGAEGFVKRYVNTMIGPFAIMAKVPLFGYGVGIGTNAAQGLYHLDQELEGPEDEWGRLIYECGPFFGFLLCVFRIALTLAVARRAYQAFRRDNILPLLLFSACGLLILNGQWGVPTTLGFAIFGAGLTLAACVEPVEENEEDHSGDEEPSLHLADNEAERLSSS